MSTAYALKGAVEDLAKSKPDLLILDVMFPEDASGGLELARRIHKNPGTRDMPVIMLTNVNQEFPLGLSPQDIDDEWMPVCDFMEKPVNFPQLERKIQTLLKPR